MIMPPSTLEEKLSNLVNFGKLKVDYQGIDCKENHSTFGGQSKRYYYYEGGSKFSSPAITSRASIFFIGAHSYINDGGYSRENVFIGRYCSIGRRVTLAAGAHAMGGLSTSPAVAGRKSQTQLSSRYASRMTLIHSDVWIGDGAVIMPGRTIGVGAVIAANAVVTRDVESHTIMAGVPAKVIGRRFSREMSERIVASNWWNIGKETLDTLNTRDIEDFLSSTSTSIIDKFSHSTYLFSNLD